MRLLIDENLPATLADLLPVECFHATGFGKNITLVEMWSTIEGLLVSADLIEIHPGVIETFQHPGI